MSTPAPDHVATASQTAGPFLHIGFAHLCRDEIVSASDDATVVSITGRMIDGDGAPVPDAALEIWQPDADGTSDQRGARGFGRVYTNDDGRFRFTTVRPGASSGSAPHLVVTLFMRGLLQQLVTRMYFPDDAANESDPVLALVPSDRRHTLIARHGASEGVVEWDIVLQGENETAFFTW